MTAKRRMAYTETYKRWEAKLRPDLNPTLPHANGMVVTEMYLLEAGKLSDGSEYQVLQFVLREPEDVER